MAGNIKFSTVQDEERDTMAGDLQGFDKISVCGTLFEMARTTIYHSEFLWRLIKDPPNSERSKKVSSRFGVYKFLVLREILAHSSNCHIADYANRDF